MCFGSNIYSFLWSKCNVILLKVHHIMINTLMGDFEKIKSKDKPVLNNASNNSNSSSGGSPGWVWQNIQEPLTQDNHNSKS